MNRDKTYLKEIAQGTEALIAARSEPIQQDQSRKSMNFLRSLSEPASAPTVQQGLPIEQMLEAQLEAEIKKHEKSLDEKDHISFDIPLLIRVFELVREGIKSDVDLHSLVERLIDLRTKGVLTMKDYDVIAGGNPNGRKVDSITSAPLAGDVQEESIDFLKKLAGIR